MVRTIAGFFDTQTQADTAVAQLLQYGIASNDISLIAHDTTMNKTTVDTVGEAAGAGAVSGGMLGGTLGLLVGVGALAIPGIGPVLAAGPLAAALGSAGVGALLGAGVGAASGGLLGALLDAGMNEDDANVYAESLRRGGLLVMVKTDQAHEEMVRLILRNNGAADLQARSSEWRRAGWSRFDAGSDTPDRAWEQSSKIGTAAGTAAGAATGAAMGSVAGPVGTAVGGVTGAVVGAATGAAGDVAGKEAEDELKRKSR